MTKCDTVSTENLNAIELSLQNKLSTFTKHPYAFLKNSVEWDTDEIIDSICFDFFGQNLSTILDRNTEKIVVTGLLCSGSTTLINAILNDNILPVATTPTTSSIVRVKYGEKKKFVTSFYDIP